MLTLLGIIGMQIRIILDRVLRNAGDKGAFCQRQVLDILRKIIVGPCSDAGNVAGQRKNIEISL
ncbi:hypothetical protein SDC9_205078 [bioreactor metagenome]|uniref:Uncharacterized protein n=1 Tax=bioreactor metagenome TaxID=1076179 RepID=A0A645JA92_9ZZZZ